jgi:FimV-like protein
MGSGNHARTYLHRTPANELLELPLGWYAEKGGYPAMNPGYDRPDHAGLSRTIPYGCMFCHNAYPQTPPVQGPRARPVFDSVPEGIDCQRCHGDSREHVRLARATGVRIEDIRKAIVNPARLPAARALEACLQCHLEPKSASTSHSIVRFEREPFSYKPGEPLADFELHFDGKPADSDRFEIAGAGAWRLMRSQCFLRSKGAMTCTTCHDPHRQVSPAEAVTHYSDICLTCHTTKLTQDHPADPDCIGCHMPKRRTQDAIHVVMTDHLIQRIRPDRDVLAPLTEEVRSDDRPLQPSYPAIAVRPEDELYLGIAMINEQSNRAEGIDLLSAALAKFKPANAEYYLQLGDALRAGHRFEEAIAPYKEAVRLAPQSAIAHDRLAFGLTRVRQFAAADAEFREASRLAPNDAGILKDIGISDLEQGRMSEAAAAFEKSLKIDAAQAEAHNGLGGARMKMGDSAGAEAEFREAIRLRPHYAEAHHNFAYLLSAAGRFDEAEYHFTESLRINGNNAETRFDYAAMLARASRADDAQHQVEAVLRLNPRHLKSLDLLGNILDRKGMHAEAIGQFRRAVEIAPESGLANLDLGAALLRTGDIVSARPFLEKAADSGDSALSSEARKLLATIH